ncbi:MAG TPA: hypothetical protein ENF26_03065 [Methanomicrobia archaeon]|nr:hypothetical protein [Methanomicrobia archaeon]HEX59113.1 hypothetical protein [Methanomicrobia archaeon]
MERLEWVTWYVVVCMVVGIIAGPIVMEHTLTNIRAGVYVLENSILFAMAAIAFGLSVGAAAIALLEAFLEFIDWVRYYALEWIKHDILKRWR